MAPPGPVTELYGYDGLLRPSPRSLRKNDKVRENGWNSRFTAEFKDLGSNLKAKSLSSSIKNSNDISDKKKSSVNDSKKGISSRGYISKSNQDVYRSFPAHIPNSDLNYQRKSHLSTDDITDEELVIRGY
jgi:hypothetical protein